MTLVRRFLVLVSFTFWLGGLMFYGAVVVPIGRRLLGPQQSLVTREVTCYLNVAGVGVLLLLAWDVFRCAGRNCWLRGAIGVGMGLCLPLLWALHEMMTAQMSDPNGFFHEKFYPIHRIYLWVSTLQWGLSVYFLWLTLRAWREEDRAPKA